MSDGGSPASGEGAWKLTQIRQSEWTQGCPRVHVFLALFAHLRILLTTKGGFRHANFTRLGSPRQFALQIAHLISHQRHYGRQVGAVHQADLQLLTGFFGNSAREVMSILAVERDRALGRDRDFLDQVVESASELL